MAETKNTKAFYNTEIPSDWEVKKFEKIAKFFSGGTPLTSKPEYYTGNIPFIKSGEIYFDKTEQFISDEGLNNSSAKMVEKGDLLYALYGANSGEVAISKIKGAINQAILCIRHNGDCETVFIYNYLIQQKENIIRTYLQGGQGNLSAEIVKTLPIPLPPLPEQKAIAQVLSTADAAIHTTEKLIAQKELRKKWLMQQLLTGKKRLKGFSGEWKKLGAGDVFKSVTKKGFANEELLSATQDRGMIPRTMLEGRVTMPTTGTEGFKLVEVGDFVISLRSFQGGLEYSFYRGLVSPAYTVLKPKKLIKEEFYKQYFKSYDFIGHLAIAVIGIRDGKQVSYDDFCTVKIPYPTIEEQTAIAQVLQTADKEISLLKAKAEKLREQKKGLMQQLLTGKVRLKIN